MKNLAIISTHPIQYYAPVFRLLTKRSKIKVKVFYTWEKGSETFDRGFAQTVKWDIPLLDGYDYTFVSNHGRQGRSFFAVQNPGLIAEIKSWAPDALLVFGWNYYSHLKCLLHFKGKALVLFRGDSHLLNEQRGLKKSLRRAWLKWVYRHVDYGLFVGANNRAYFLKHGLTNQQLVFAPHAIDNDRFNSDPNGETTSRALSFRESLGFTSNDIVLLLAGKLEPVKNPALLISAVSSLDDQRIKLLVVGNGPLEKEFQEQFKNNSNIVFIGFQNQSIMPIVYRAADLYCLPSKSETWGLAVNEAMACSRPVLVSDKVGCAVDLVREGVNGFVFRHDDQVDLIKKISHFANLSIGERNNLGLNAQQLIANWNFSAIAESIESIVCR